MWKKVKIEPAARPKTTARAKRAPLDSNAGGKRQPKPLPRRTTGLLVKYRGGPEGWWELSYAGKTVRVQGYICIHDAMRLLFEGELRSGDET